MDIIAPLYKMNYFGYEGSLIIGFTFGFLFGTALEKAGFGSSRKLTAQFYLHDMTVYKVMFTAVVTALVCIQISVGLGLLEFELLFVPSTYLWPQIVGGLLLGVGFMVGGYCPGTSVVSVASGKIDGMVFVIGFFVGLLIFPHSFDALFDFYNSGSLGRITLFDFIPLPGYVVGLILAVMAIASFFGVTKLEKWVKVQWPYLKY